MLRRMLFVDLRLLPGPRLMYLPGPGNSVGEEEDQVEGDRDGDEGDRGRDGDVGEGDVGGGRAPAPEQPRGGALTASWLEVSSQAEEFLFDLVELDGALALADIFGLFEASPTLKAVFRRDWARELAAEARLGPVARSEPRADGAIEFLELRRGWTLDTRTQTYGPTHQLDLVGIGAVLTADAPQEGKRRGERIRWGLSLTPVRELLSLPLRFSAEVEVDEDDIDAKAWGRPVAQVRLPAVTLGEVINGVLNELSFHGGPPEQAAFREELDRRVEESHAHPERLIPAEEVFARFDRPGLDAMFETLGGRSRHEVQGALREIDDTAIASEELAARFGGEVVVKPRYRRRTGHEFRRLFRAAGR